MISVKHKENLMNYTPTQWDTAEDKARFVKHFIQFVKKDFHQSMFNKKFYNRLSMTFGHIAHYDRGGFWDTFFTNTADKSEFLRMTMNFPCYGDPKFTYCDAEREIQNQLKEMNVLQKYIEKVNSEQNQIEYNEYKRLKNKFEKDLTPA